jgi:hypothetical protein
MDELAFMVSIYFFLTDVCYKMTQYEGLLSYCLNNWGLIIVVEYLVGFNIMWWYGTRNYNCIFDKGYLLVRILLRDIFTKELHGVV